MKSQALATLTKSALLFAGILYAVLTLAAEPSPDKGAAPQTRVSSVGGVTVKVTPKNLASPAKTWDFAVVLDTHSAELNDDLMKSALLIDAAGGKYAPLAWDGAQAGGHHREGILKFKTPDSQPQIIELQIMRAGESVPRSFRWQVQ